MLSRACSSLLMRGRPPGIDHLTRSPDRTIFIWLSSASTMSTSAMGAAVKGILPASNADRSSMVSTKWVRRLISDWTRFNDNWTWSGMVCGLLKTSSIPPLILVSGARSSCDTSDTKSDLSSSSICSVLFWSSNV